jgi:alpha-L-fucosidase
MTFTQKDYWADLAREGDWIIEERISVTGKSYGLTLCVMQKEAGRVHEVSIQLPYELGNILRSSNLTIKTSEGWED